MSFVKVYASTGQYVGDYDLKGHVYSTQRDNKKSQIFFKREFGSAVGLSKSIIRQLIGLERGFYDDTDESVTKRIRLRFLLLNFEKGVVLYEISLFDFLLHGCETYFGGAQNADEQYRVALKHFYKVDLKQEKLGVG